MGQQFARAQPLPLLWESAGSIYFASSLFADEGQRVDHVFQENMRSIPAVPSLPILQGFLNFGEDGFWNISEFIGTHVRGDR